MAVLYLLPAFLGENSPKNIFSEQEMNLLKELKHFASENEKTARRFIKFLCPEVIQSELSFSVLNKRTSQQEIELLAEPLKKGENMGLISEAGLPCIADPGNLLVSWCHRNDIRVFPVNGPSSIILALIASGLNGQSFSFHGYLPIDSQQRKKSVQHLESISKNTGSSQIFMETPYRNQSLFDDLLKYLHPQTQLCVATHITLPDETILTLSCREWKAKKMDFHKKPTIFIIQA
ncbi:SAM-dependent methyltransferase [Apibacter sp. HY039]|uniref:SAM-dependent methyltransferase n=1 Tax=Apibacter sp. HY039 TaxID=2501476 RepID=UPI000FEBC896|nr:SAM-dependent methyltransferase [Apibacter sp. HY039]